MIKKRYLTKISATVSIILTSAILCSAFPSGVKAAETPDSAYTGITNSAAVLENLKYNDINTNTWSKEAVYQSGALGIIKGYGNRAFGRTAAITKEEALAIVYRAAGRESEAQIAGETLNAARTGTNKKTNTQEVWYDGYLQLASKDGLITQQDYADAMNTDQSSLTGESFHRRNTAERQEMACWLLKALKKEPVRGQQNVFNNYLDWKSADPDKIPYIETALQMNIMSGEGARFRPSGTLTREQAAQIIKNIEPQMLLQLKLEKQTGTIESITTTRDGTVNPAVNVRLLSVRNNSGMLHEITTRIPLETSGNPLNEQSGSKLASGVNDLVVYKNGAMGNSSLLKKGDRLDYIVNAADKTVKYVRVISNANEIRYVAAQISSIDRDNLLINALRLFNVDYPDIKALTQNVRFVSDKDAGAVSYKYSRSVLVTVNDKAAAITDIYPDMTVILAIMNNNVISAIQTADFNINSEENRIVKGIVEENNPQLGYITLYNENGTGSGKSPAKKLASLRTYNYLNQNRVDALKNHKKAGIEDIEPGDTAYIMLEEDGSISSVSAVDNYYVKYGKVITKSPGELAVQFDDGSQQLLKIGSNVLVISDRKLDSYNSIKDGDRVKLQINATEGGTAVKEITVEDGEHFISNIYKGEALEIDDMASKASVLNLQQLNREKWEPAQQKGFTGIQLADGCKLYFNDREIELETAEKLLSDNQAYIAMERDYGGTEKAVLISFRNEKDTEVPYSDIIASIESGSGSFSLDREYKNVKYEPGSIIVKNGRLVTAASLMNKDKALVVANRDYTTGEFKAGVVKIDEQSDLIKGRLYRGRIKNINESSDFTVESYSVLNGTDWSYANTPKTFKLSFSTRLLDDNGVADVRGFKGYGTDNYLNRTVYILADDTNAMLISTAPYGVYNARGTVYGVTGAETGEEGTVLKEPGEIMLRNVRGYNSTGYLWQDVKDMDLGLLQNSLIFKNGNIVKASDIKVGDTVRVIKKEAGETGTAFIVMIE